MRFFTLDPEVAGGFGEDTDLDATVHPPRVFRLHYHFEGWLGDELLTTFPCYIVTARLMNALHALGPTGCSFAPVRTTTSEQFHQLFFGTKLPEFWWMKVEGRPGQDDVALSGPPEYLLVVSEPILECLRRHNIAQCTIADFDR